MQLHFSVLFSSTLRTELSRENVTVVQMDYMRRLKDTLLTLTFKIMSFIKSRYFFYYYGL